MTEITEAMTDKDTIEPTPCCVRCGQPEWCHDGITKHCLIVSTYKAKDLPPVDGELGPHMAKSIADELTEKSGFWNSCSGCHESHSGVPHGPWSDMFKCHVGMGCAECGGIGVVWDNTDYSNINEPAALSQPTDALKVIDDLADNLEETINDFVEVAAMQNFEGDVDDWMKRARKSLTAAQLYLGKIS